MFLNNFLSIIICCASLLFTSSYEINTSINNESNQFNQFNQSNSYSLTIATNSVWLSGASYCDKDIYKTMSLGGPVTDFKLTDIIYDKKSDMQGYVGVLPSTKSIYVVFRGSSSTLNWLDDFEIILIPYDTYPECKCKVHTGFYHTTLAIKDQVIDAINKQKKINPTYNIISTGHSLGAIISLMISLELKKVAINALTYNYGQPRGGDKIFASFVNSKLGLTNYYRFVHNKDMVPHVPPLSFGYYHSCTEIFEEDDDHNLITCSNINCEDPKCSNKYSINQLNTEDHSIYLTHTVSCSASIL